LFSKIWVNGDLDLAMRTFLLFVSLVLALGCDATGNGDATTDDVGIVPGSSIDRLRSAR
jgi:hypothetical protein